jgi:hypothetical protein
MSLSSLIVQREVASMRQVEEALARQVIYGGDLVTNLMEVARVDEAAVTRLLAESMSLPAAPLGELPVVGERLRALVPSDVAAQRTVVPMLVDGETLVLAVSEPIAPDFEEQLAFSLGMTIEQRAAPAVRVKQAIARIYGIPLERRMQRLIARLSGEPSTAGSMPPPLGAVPAVAEPPRPPSAPPRTTSRNFLAARPFPPPQEIATPVAPPPPAAAPPVAPPPPPPLPEHAVPEHVQEELVTHEPGIPPAEEVVSSRPRPSPVSDSAPPSSPVTAERRAGLLQREVPQSVRSARRRRGPLTFDAAKREAEEGDDRDALLDLFFDFSRQFFDYAALFLVHGDIAEGRDAFGAGASREKVVGIGIPLDLPCLLASVRDQRAPVVAFVPSGGLDAELLADLQRPRSVEAAFVPVVVRTRAVAILVGDCGDHGVERTASAQVIAFAGVIGKAFERIIVRRKLDGFIAGGKGSTTGRIDPEQVMGKRPSGVPQARLPGPRSTPSPWMSGSAPARASAPAAPARASAPAPEPPQVHVPAPSPQPSLVSALPGTYAGSLPQGVPPQPSAPPPRANIAATRAISGPPIPREDPPDSDRRDPPSSEPTVDILIDEPDLDDEAPARELFDELGLDGAPPEDSPPPPPSAAIAVPPHKPPLRHTEPPVEASIIVDADPEVVAMIDRLVATGELDEQAEGELLRQGERAMRVLMTRFPGPLTFDRSRIATMLLPPRASECGPVLRLIARERRVALPFVLDRLAATDPETRGWATHILCELPYLEAIGPLLPRLRDEDPATSASAAYALCAIGRSHPSAVRSAVLAIAHSADPLDRVAAMLVAAELRDPALVPEIVHLLADGDERVVYAAHDALVAITMQDLGLDARPWMRWWETNAARHRVEWLIDALTHEVSEIRRAAGEELRAASKEYFGFAAELPARDRERAQQRYRDWWITEGRARFKRR